MKKKIEDLSALEELEKNDLIDLVEDLSKEITRSYDEFKEDTMPFCDTAKSQIDCINNYLKVYHMYDDE